MILSKDSWEEFQHWYGGGPAIPRKIISVENGQNNR
jgi:hypothetical protein